ncbi:MAG: glutaredoxin family protein [Candidatus Margulisbacteria bacterium]|nr:glutaredoxin family protein [Candidatus Margulisiibacteriota bacterium]
MLSIYGAKWCPHTKATVNYLKEHNISFQYHEMEEQTEEVTKKVIEANGGEDWVVPTLEFKGKWREGKSFNPQELKADLKKMGVI